MRSENIGGVDANRVIARSVHVSRKASQNVAMGRLERRSTIDSMNKAISIVLVIGFLAVDFLFFHDFFKPGEIITPAQYLTGLLSLVVFGVAAQVLWRGRQAH